MNRRLQVHSGRGACGCCRVRRSGHYGRATRRMRPDMPLDPATKNRLEGISTATVTTLLLKKGLRNIWMRGPLPFTASARGKRLVGPAFTLRFVPAR